MKINSRKPFKRCNRIADHIKEIVSQIFLKETFFANYVMVSVVNVEVSQDLRNAKIYLSFYSKDDTFTSEDYLKYLKSKLGKIKFIIGNKMQTKYVPKIKFFISDEYKHYDKINRLLKNG